MAEPKLLVEINGEAGGLFSILAKVQERLDAVQQGSTSSADAARKSMGALEQGAKAAAQAVKVAEAELASIQKRLAASGAGLGIGGDPAAAMAKLQQAQAAYARIQAQQFAVEQALGQQRVMSYLRAAQAVDTSTRSLQAHAQAVNQADQAHHNLSGAVFRGGAALMALRAALEGAWRVLGSVLESNLALERAQRTLNMATGDGAGAMAFVRRTAKELGLELVQTADGYAMMAAAAKGTTMEGKAAEQVFRSVARASAAMSLSGESTHGVILALSQMMSKGKVMAEELRKQLGEHLPGAFNIAARAMGVTTAELDEMLRNGKVISSDFLPKFARELELAMGDAPEKASQSLQANINRIKTAFQSLSYEIGQGGAGDSLSRALGDIAQAMNSPEGLAAAREMSRGLGEVITAAKDLALVLWKVREPVVALGLAWLTIKAAQIVQGLYEWGKAKVVVVQQTLAARQALIQEALATEGLTLAKGQNAQAEIARALAMVASRKATLENAVATGGLSLAEAAAARESIALTEAKLAEAAAMAASSRAAGLGSGVMAAMGGPIGLLIAAIGGLVFVLSQMEDASKKVAKAESERLALAARSRSDFQGLADDAQRLDEILQSASSSADQKTRAQQQMQTVIKQMLQIYPDFINFLQKEGDLYIWTTESLRKETEQKLANAKADEQSAISALKAAEAKVAAAWAVAKAENEAGASVKSWFARRDAKEEEENYKRLKDNYMMALKARQDLEVAMEKLLNPAKPNKITTPKPEFNTSGIITPDEIEARLDALRLAHLEEVTLVQKRDAAMLRAEKEYATEAARIKKEADSGKFDGNQEGVDALWFENQERRRRAEEKAEREFLAAREKMAADLQAKLTAEEEGGLAKRLEAVRRNFVAFREENAKLVASGAKGHTEAEIQAAEDAAKARARVEQVRADLTRLKRELSELAMIKGGPLTSGEMAEALDRFAKSSSTAADASAKLREELHLNEGATAGWSAGVRQYLTNAENAYEVFKSKALQVLNGVENAFAKGIEGMISGQMSLKQAMKSIWQGILQTIIQAVAQIIARWIVMSIVGNALTSSEVSQSNKRRDASLEAGAAGAWEAYGAIPYYGWALALAQIALMVASVEGVSISSKASKTFEGQSLAEGGETVTGAAEGGWFDRPTKVIMGEGWQRELAVPEVSFKEFAYNLAANILNQERAVQGYGRQAAGYARLSREAGGPMPPTIIQITTGPILGESAESGRIVGDYVHQALQERDRRNA